MTPKANTFKLHQHISCFSLESTSILVQIIVYLAGCFMYLRLKFFSLFEFWPYTRQVPTQMHSLGSTYVSFLKAGLVALKLLVTDWTLWFDVINCLVWKHCDCDRIQLRRMLGALRVALLMKLAMLTKVCQRSWPNDVMSRNRLVAPPGYIYWRLGLDTSLLQKGSWCYMLIAVFDLLSAKKWYESS